MLFGVLIPVVIVIISLWEAVGHLFYQHNQRWMLISFPVTAEADSDYIQYQRTKKELLETLLRDSLLSQRRVERRRICILVWGLIDVHGRIVQLQSILL